MTQWYALYVFQYSYERDWTDTSHNLYLMDNSTNGALGTPTPDVLDCLVITVDTVLYIMHQVLQAYNENQGLPEYELFHLWQRRL